jgi:hypothetical protein
LSAIKRIADGRFEADEDDGLFAKFPLFPNRKLFLDKALTKVCMRACFSRARAGIWHAVDVGTWSHPFRTRSHPFVPHANPHFI